MAPVRRERWLLEDTEGLLTERSNAGRQQQQQQQQRRQQQRRQQQQKEEEAEEQQKRRGEKSEVWGLIALTLLV